MESPDPVLPSQDPTTPPPGVSEVPAETPPAVPPEAAPLAPPPPPVEYDSPRPAKAEPPAAPLSARERRAAIEAGQKTKRRRGFLWGLLAGQLLVIGIDLGFPLARPLIEQKYRFDSPLPVQSLVFIAMSVGVVLTGLFLFLILGLRGIGYIFGRKQVGFFTAAGRGIRRAVRAVGAIGLTLAVIGGTAWFMIPSPAWKPTWDYLAERKDRAVEKAQTLTDDLLGKLRGPTKEQASPR